MGELKMNKAFGRLIFGVFFLQLSGLVAFAEAPAIIASQAPAAVGTTGTATAVENVTGAGNSHSAEAKEKTVATDNTATAVAVPEKSISPEKGAASPEKSVLPVSGGKAQYELEDVVVTGTKTQLKIKESPAAVSVVTQADVEKKDVVYIDDAVANLPGVQVARTEKGDQSTVVTIRGIPNYDKNLILLDGNSIQNPYNGRVFWNRVPTELVDRIEVVRGPFSSLYGKYALGGVINILTKEPQGTDLNFKYGYDSTNIRTTAANFSDKPADQFAYYVGFENESVDGYTYHQYIQKTAKTGTSAIKATGYEATTDVKGNTIYNIGEAPRAQIENNNFTGKAYYFPAKGQTLSFLANYSDWDQPTQYGTLGKSWLHDASGNPISSGTVELAGTGKTVSVSQTDFFRGPGKNKFYSANLQYKGELNDLLSLTGNFEYTNRPYYNSIGTIGSNATALTGSATGSSFGNNNRELGNIQATLTGEAHRLIVGTEYQSSHNRGTFDQFPNWTNIDDYTVLYDSDRSNEVIGAVFLQDEWKLLNQLSAFIGARYDNWTTKDGESYDTKLGKEVLYDSRTKAVVSPKISLVYKPVEAASIRASAGTAFNPPTHQELYYYSLSSTNETVPNPDLTPEIDKAWELGGEYSFPTQTTVSATYFANYLTDLIYSQATITGANGFTTTTNTNAGKAEIKGVETEVKQPITSDLTTFANYTFVDPKIVENNAAPTSVGKLIPNISQHTANIGVDYKWEKLETILTGTYASKRYRSADNSDTVNGVQGSYDPYTTANIKFIYQLYSGAKISLGVDNITDLQYYTIYKTPGRTYNLAATFNIQ
jgi:iron complex outermembrane receptor protein